MKRKSYFEVLGVETTATDEEIRKAYLVRSRMFHPDRFDRASQSTEWELANEMLKELNEAYAILKDPRVRAAHASDASARSGRPADVPPPPPPRHDSPPRSRVSLEHILPGFSAFSKLPENIQARLRERIFGARQRQLAIPLRGVGWNYFFLLLFFGWFFVLFSYAQGAKWEDVEFYWLGGFTLVAGIVNGMNFSLIYRYHTASIRPTLIVSPLYIIRTTFDEVWFWPIWEIRDLRATHNYRNSMYTGTDVSMSFSTGPLNVSFSSEGAYNQMRLALQVLGDGLKQAQLTGDLGYFSEEDDFRAYSSRDEQTPRTIPTRFTTLSCLGAVAIYVVVFLVAIGVNNQARPSPSTYSPVPPARPVPTIAPAFPSPLFDQPEQSLPKNGEVKIDSSLERVAPFQIQSPLGINFLIKLEDAVTKKQVMTIFVRGGETTEVEVPLGTFIVKYASGDVWYGDKYLFGPDTQYARADQNFKFAIEAGDYVGYTLKLSKVRNGNLHESPLRPSDF